MGNIVVTVQREDRLSAIRDLAGAVHQLAKALNTATEVHIVDCHVKDCDTGILVDTSDAMEHTEIKETP